MTEWISAFVVTALMASHRLNPVLVLGILAAVSAAYFFAFAKTWQAMALLMGGCWGLWGHGALPRGGEHARVTSAAPIAADSYYLVLKSDDGERLAATGLAGIGQSGKIQCRDQVGVLADSRCHFVPERKLALNDSLPTRFQMLLGPITSRRWRGWLGGLLLGQASMLSPEIKRIFKETGLYHLLIVSGLHLNVVGVMLSYLLRLPLQCLYVLRLLRPQTWMFFQPLFPLLNVVLCFFYLLATGSSSPAQRAFIVHAMAQLSPIFFGRIPSLHRLLGTAFLQTLCFPLGFLSLGTLLSWSAYIFVLYVPERNAHGFWQNLRRSAVTQVWLCLLIFALIGSLTPLAIVTNLLITPLFPIVFAVALFSLIAAWWAPEWLGLLFSWQSWGIDLVSLFADFGLEYTEPLRTSVGAWGTWLRFLALFIVGLGLLEQLKNLGAKQCQTVGKTKRSSSSTTPV